MKSRATDRSSGEGLSGLRSGAHVCHIYEDEADRLRAVVEWASCAVANGCRFLYLANEESKREARAAMKRAGVDPENTGRRQIVFLTERSPFCADGLFSADSMLGMVASEVARSRAEGFAGLYVAVEMAWVLGSELETMRVLDWESSQNDAPDEARPTLMCQWDSGAVEPMILLEVLHTHPHVASGGAVYQNVAYYVPPAEYPASRSAQDQLNRQLGVLRRLHEEREAAPASKSTLASTA